MELILKYFPSLSEKQLQQFCMLNELYSYWNNRINVISRKDIEHLEMHHILHSLSISRIIRFKPSTYILDAGTGGGFPGIPLAIFFPEVSFTLVDSIGKKIKVVDEIVRSVKLENIETRHERIENLHEKYDFIVSRAFGQLPDLLKFSQGLIRRDAINFLQNGILYLKGGEIEEELNRTERRFHVYYLSNFFYEPWFETKKIIHIY
ncbi:MAG: 16S rRNA (guanine(527)-N(7))-methyltransferase RsmG [Lentimicrobium sp.]